MPEIYYSGDNTRVMAGAREPESDEPAKLVANIFPWFRREDYYSISTPAMHEVLGEPVVTCCLPLQATDALVGPGYALGNRKFCMNSHTSFMRLYRVFTGQKPAWLPPSAQVLFIGDNHDEYRRPCHPKATSFYDLYMSADPDEMEAAFKLPRRRGAYETYYGVTVVNGEPARVKQYIYDSQDGFSDWDVIYMVHKKKPQQPSN